MVVSIVISVLCIVVIGDFFSFLYCLLGVWILKNVLDMLFCFVVVVDDLCILELEKNIIWMIFR